MPDKPLQQKSILSFFGKKQDTSKKVEPPKKVEPLKKVEPPKKKAEQDESMEIDQPVTDYSQVIKTLCLKKRARDRERGGEITRLLETRTR